MLQLHHMHDTSWQVHRFWSKSPKNVVMATRSITIVKRVVLYYNDIVPTPWYRESIRRKYRQNIGSLIESFPDHNVRGDCLHIRAMQ